MNRILNATAENFEELVIKGSASRYVLVDFSLRSGSDVSLAERVISR